MGIIDNDAPKRRRVGLIYDDRMCKHSDPHEDHHPENPDRIRAIWDRLNVSGLAKRCIVLNAKEAKDNHLALVHSKEHIKLIKTISSTDSVTRRDTAAKLDSIYFNEGSSEASYLAAGSVIEAAEKVGKGELDSAFAIVRPPGHHAEEAEAMGFCLYNNVAVATSFLLNRKPELGVGKILIVDWDVHHGNGTQKMFYKDPRVLFFSVHRHDSGRFYPYSNDGSCNMTGEGPGAGYNINVPWENGGYGDADYFAVWDQILIPVAKEFNPDIIMISAGFDAALGDPIGGCCLSPYGYSIMLDKLMGIGGGKIVMALEGGYDPVPLASSAQACVEVLLQDRPILRSVDDCPLKSTGLVIQTVRQALSTYWPVLAAKLPDKVINSRPSQTEDIADASSANVQANSIVEQVHIADKQIDPKPKTGGSLMHKFIFGDRKAVKPDLGTTSPVVGSPPRPTVIELQPLGLSEAPDTEDTGEPLVFPKGKRPSRLLPLSLLPKRPRPTTGQPAQEMSSREKFSFLECEDPKHIHRYMRETALSRDKEIVSKMSHDDQMDQIGYYTAKAFALCSARSDNHKLMREKIDRQRKEIKALKAECKRIEGAKLLKATCQLLESRVEELEKEVARANDEFAHLVEMNSKKKEIERKKSYTKGFNAFALSSEGRALADRYREALMPALLNSTFFLSKTAPLARFYYFEAFRLAQEDIRKAGLELVLDPEACLARLGQETTGWSGNPDEPEDYPWWEGMYEKLVGGISRHSAKSSNPSSLAKE